MVLSFVHLVLNHSSTYTVFCLHGCFSKVLKKNVSRGPPVFSNIPMTLRTGRLKKNQCNYKRFLIPLWTCTSSNNTYVVIFVTKLDPLYILQAPFNLKCTMTLNPVVLVLTKELKNRIYRAKLLWKNNQWHIILRILDRILTKGNFILIIHIESQ